MEGLALFVEAMENEEIKETVESLFPEIADHFGQKHRFAVVNGRMDVFTYFIFFGL